MLYHQNFESIIRLGHQKVMHDLLKWSTTIPTTGAALPSDKNTPEGDFFSYFQIQYKMLFLAVSPELLT